MQRSPSCRSRRELSNEYLLAKIGVDTAENEPCKDLQASSALWNREIFAILTLIGVWGMKIIMKVHQKMGRVSRPVFYIKWHWMGSGGKHIRKHIQVRSIVKRSCPKFSWRRHSWLVLWTFTANRSALVVQNASEFVSMTLIGVRGNAWKKLLSPTVRS